MRSCLPSPNRWRSISPSVGEMSVALLAGELPTAPPVERLRETLLGISPGDFLGLMSIGPPLQWLCHSDARQVGDLPRIGVAEHHEESALTLAPGLEPRLPRLAVRHISDKYQRPFPFPT